MWALKNEKELHRNRLVDTENKLRVARWEGVGELGEKDEGIKKCKSARGRTVTEM